MMRFTVFWSHPELGSGSLQQKAGSAQAAGEEAMQALVEAITDETDDELEMAIIRDEFGVEVWEGVHTLRPTTPADFVYT